MAKKKSTTDDLMNELNTIKKLLLKNLQISQDELKIDKELDEKLIKSETERIFNNLTAWEAEIWENCKHKVKADRKGEIVYNCKLLKSRCTFEDCPLNRKKHK